MAMQVCTAGGERVRQFIKTMDGWYDLNTCRHLTDEEYTAATTEEKPKKKKSGEQAQ